MLINGEQEREREGEAEMDDQFGEDFLRTGSMNIIRINQSDELIICQDISVSMCFKRHQAYPIPRPIPLKEERIFAHQISLLVNTVGSSILYH